MKSDLTLHRQFAALFVSVFLFVLILYTLEKTGVPRQYSFTLSGISLFALWLITTFSGGTTKASRFLSADQNLPSVVNTLAMIACITFPILLSDGGGLFFNNPSFLITIGIGIVTGMGLSALIFSGPVRERGFSDIVSLLNDKFNSSLPGKTASFGIALTGLGFAICGLTAGSSIMSWFFNISTFNSLLVFSAASLLAANLGGILSNSRLASVGIILLILGINLPLIVRSYQEAGLPIGQFTFGYGALETLWDLEDQLSSLKIPLLNERLSPTSQLLNWQYGNQILAGIMIAATIVVSPLLIQQYASAKHYEESSNSAIKSILGVAFLLVSLFALLAFTKIGIYQSLLGLSVSDARVEAPFLHAWAGREIDLVTVCGKAINGPIELQNACPDGTEHLLNISDLTLFQQMLFVTSPDLLHLPFAFSAILAISIILTLCAFTASVFLTSANNLVTAFKGSNIGDNFGGKIFYGRLIVLIVTIVAMFFTFTSHVDRFSLFMFSNSLLAAMLLPVLISIFYFPNISAAGAVTAMTLGFAVTALYFVLSDFGIDLVKNSGDEFLIRLPFSDRSVPSVLGGIFGVISGTVILLIDRLIPSQDTQI